MATYKFNKKNIQKVMDKFRKRALHVQQSSSRHAVQYLLNFGYHAILPSGPNANNGPGYSYYYAANWNLSVGSPDKSVISPARDAFNAKPGEYELELDEKKTQYSVNPNSSLSDVIYVTNSVYYGKWLNDGGVSFLTHLTDSNPNRFMEFCENYLRENAKKYIKEAKKEVK